MSISWGRIVLAAILLEVAITAVALPVGFVFGSPMSTDPGVPPADGTVFYVVVALACFGFGWVFGAWAVARATSGFALQGLLVGLVAMAMYFGMLSLAPGGIAGVISAYGVGMFIAFNGLRTLGCVLGGWYRGTKLSGAPPAR